MKVLTFGASLRKDSFNKQLIRSVVSMIQDFSELEINHVDFADFRMPVYDGDLEVNEGLPENTQKIAHLIHATDALIISTPEYNASIPGPFKNAIDWVSRIKPAPWQHKHILLMGASMSDMAAVRGLWHSRVPLEKLECFVYPEMFGLPKAQEAFDKADQLKDSKSEEYLGKIIHKFSEHVQKWTEAKK